MGIFTRKPLTVDEAISGLLLAQRALEIVTAERDASAARLRNESDQLLSQAELDKKEGLRARKVLQKLQAITENTEEQE